MINPTIERQQIAQAVVDQFLFADLSLGRADCASLCAAVLDAYSIDHPLKRAGRYRTVAGAARALKRQGFDDLTQALDSIGLQRIAPAEALPTDLIAIQADRKQVGGWSLGVAVGPNKVMAFIPHDGRIFADTGNLLELCVHAATAGLEVIAWRVG